MNQRDKNRNRIQYQYRNLLNIDLSSTYKCNFLGADNKQ